MKKKSCLILIFFQIFGLFMISVKNSQFWEKFLKFLNLFYIFLAIFTLGIALVYKEMIFDIRTTLGAIMDIIQLAFPVATTVLSLIESFRKREILRRIWNEFQFIQRLLFKISIQSQSSMVFTETYKTFLKKFIIFNGSATFIEIFILIRLREDYPWLRHRSAAFLPSLITRSAVFLYILHVDIFGAISKQIATIFTEISTRDKILPEDRRNVKICWIIMTKLWLCTEYLRKTFAPSLLGIITSYCILLTVNFYWNFKAFFRKSTTNVLESSLCSTPFLLSLLPLGFSGELYRVRRRTIFTQITGIASRCSARTSFGRILRNISLSGLQDELTITSWQFLSIDRRLLSEISQTIGIYLTIFIQFEITYYGQYVGKYVYSGLN
ncbi:hypothetical protein DMENIID0001_151990 [Sergentomyia squamirostris]